MTNAPLILLFLFTACASPQTPAESTPARAEATTSEESPLADSLPPALNAHGFERIRALPEDTANPTQNAGVEYPRVQQGVSVAIVDGEAFAIRHFSGEPRSERHLIPAERAQRYLDAAAEAHAQLQQDSVDLDGPSRHHSRSLTVEGPECLVAESMGACTYYGLSSRGYDAPVSDNERAYIEARDTLIELTTSVVDEVFAD